MFDHKAWPSYLGGHVKKHIHTLDLSQASGQRPDKLGSQLPKALAVASDGLRPAASLLPDSKVC